MDYFYLPKEYHSVHKACFELVGQIEEFVVGKEYQFLRVTQSPLTDMEKDQLLESGDISDFLKTHREEKFYTLLRKQLILGLLMDFCYFMQESLEYSKKMRLVVSYSLLRRPLVDNLKILLRVLLDADFYDNFIEKDDYDPASMKEEDLKELLKAADNLRMTKPITGEVIYECIYEKNNPVSIVNLSNKAIHPVTTRPWNKTGAMNCNFMFMTPEDNKVMWKQYYAYLLAILIFYSELFNTAVFGLFQDEVDVDLYANRLVTMTKIMNRGLSGDKNNET